MQYVLFLRGINVGGKQVKMDLLKKVFEEKGFKNVKTILASGNIIFESENRNIKEIIESIKKILAQTWKFSIEIILLQAEAVKKLVLLQPFKKVKITSETRLYVSFFQEKTENKLLIPFTEGNLKIISVFDFGVSCVVNLSKDFGTTDAMKILEREFGKHITTRNWNTIEKINFFLV